VVAHTGMGGRSSYDTTNVGAENVAAELAGLSVKPDVVVVGHSHREFADSVINGVHFVQPRAWGESLAVVHVWMERDPETEEARVVRISSDQVSLATVVPHPVVSQRLIRAHESVRLWVATPLARAEGNWSAHYARAMDTPVIDFVNEVQRSVTGAQLSGTPAFDLTVNWGPDIRLRDVASLYPYENTLKVVRIDGATLKEYLEHSARYYKTYPSDGSMIEPGIPGHAFDIVNGVDYVLDLSQPPGSRVRQLAWHQRLVQPTDTFTLTINNYRQSGGGGYTMLASLPVVYEGGKSVSDLITARIREVGVLREDEYFEPSWTVSPAAALEAIQRELGPPPPAAGVARAQLSDTAETVFTVPDTGHREPPPRPLPTVAQMKYPAEMGEGENPLGRLIADALKNGARTQFAIALNAAIGGDLPAGSVTMQDLAAVLPDNDSLLRLEVPGEELYEALEHILSGTTPNAHVAGMEVWYDPARHVGDRVRRVRFPDGEGVNRNRVYSLAVTASIATGGSGFEMLSTVPRQSAGMTALDALAGYLPRLRQPADIPRDARFHPTR
jgi:2',3'-cyclic-nucleotide 2'-phosphodiesterase (5'-nucleotidase family)